MIDMNKKYQTRGGQKVQIFTTDNEHNTYNVVGSVGGFPQAWDKNGVFDTSLDEDHHLDLVEVPEPQVLYVLKCDSAGFFTVDYYTDMAVGKLIITEQDGKISIDFEQGDF